MNILVTGGAGYIGSHMVKVLADAGHSVIIVDSLEQGFQDAVDSRATFVQGDLLQKSFVDSLFTDYTLDAVIHFAAYISVAESMQHPGKYFRNNIQGLINILEAMDQHKVSNIIFSSTAAVYGTPKIVPIPEDHDKAPESPYGESKLMAENILAWYNKTKHIHYVVLRYFNACGAALDASIGERHNPETHLIPNAIQAAMQGSPFTLYGDDYDTPDGTCVRDYIHVLDLAHAHMAGLEKLQRDPGTYTYNVGTGKGFSNREVVEMVKKVTGKDIEITIADRRPGDPAQLIANVDAIQRDLGFNAQYSDLESIITSAFAWHAKK